MKPIIGSLILIIAFSFAFKPMNTTSLRIKIHNELGNIEDSVEVTLYKSMVDYRKEVNPAFRTRYTNEKGRTTFKNVEPIIYYIHAEKGDKDNIGKGVVSDTLKAGQLNKLTIIIE